MKAHTSNRWTTISFKSMSRISTAARYAWRTGSQTWATLKASGSGTTKEDDCGTSLPLLSTCKVQIAEGIDQQNMWSKKLKNLALLGKKTQKQTNKPEMSENLVLKLQICHGIACLNVVNRKMHPSRVWVISTAQFPKEKTLE